MDLEVLWLGPWSLHQTSKQICNFWTAVAPKAIGRKEIKQAFRLESKNLRRPERPKHVTLIHPFPSTRQHTKQHDGEEIKSQKVEPLIHRRSRYKSLRILRVVAFKAEGPPQWNERIESISGIKLLRAPSASGLCHTIVPELTFVLCPGIPLHMCSDGPGEQHSCQSWEWLTFWW